MHNRILTLACLCSLAFSACQAARKKEAEQQIVPADQRQVLAAELSKNLEKAFGAWKDEAVERIVNGMIDALVAADPAYQKEVSGTRAHLLATATPYIAAGLGKTVYLSRGVLAGAKYENELAFLLATQLSLLKDGVPSANLANLQGQEFGGSLVLLPTAPPPMARTYFIERGWFDPGGLFDFGSNAYLNAEREGIRLVYAAKFDPRGAVTLIQRWTSPPMEAQTGALGKILPEADERIDSARQEVAKLSPLRDPVVKSQAFEVLQSRLHVKKARAKKN